MKRWIVVGIVVLGALAFWFVNRQRKKANTERLVQQCEQDGASEEQFETKLPRGKPYRAAEYEMLTRKFASIKQGDTRSAVRSLLGPPSYVRPNVEGDGAEFNSCYWAYVTQRSIEGEHELDDVIHVFFDPAGRVRSHFRKNESWTTIRLEDVKPLRK